MMQAQKEKQQAAGKGGGAKASAGANVQDAGKEMTKTKEQLEEEKKISLAIRIKPLDVESMDSDQLGSKAKELWETIVRLETEKYDLEERQKRQDYDLKELKERQKQQLRQKAMKKGLDPEALTGKYPPKIRMYSKYERRTDTRTYEDRKKLYEGHRSNLLGMGVLPLQFKDGESAETLGLTGHETFSFDFGGSTLSVGQDIGVTSSTGKTFVTTCRLDTDPEVAYFMNGGILRYVLRKLI